MSRFNSRPRDPADDQFIDIGVYVHAVSLKAVLLSRPGDSDRSAVWFPKSQISASSALRMGDEVTIGVKRWFLSKENILDWEV